MTVSPADTGRPDRPDLIGSAIAWGGRWGLRLLILAATLWLFGWIIGQFWVVVMPVLLGLLITTVLWPPARWLIGRGWPAALASSLMLIAGLLVLAGMLVLIIPAVVNEAPTIADQAGGGLEQLETWLTGPPFNLSEDQIASAVSAAVDWLQNSAASIAGGLISGVSAAGGILVTGVTALVLVFFFLKDGRTFLPWVRRTVGDRVGVHLAEVLSRSYGVLGSFILTQVIVSLVDAVLIGLGLWVLKVPLAFPLAVITFFGGFIPIVGAFAAGAIAVLVALVTNGWVNALFVLALIVVVQQVEGNVLQPILQSKSLNMHAAVVLLAVLAGGSLFGITGAFLAVPAVAVFNEIWRYLDGHIAKASGEPPASRAEPVSGEPDEDTAEQRPADQA